MEKNEIVINGVHHVLVKDFSDCSDCSLKGICWDSLEFVHDTLCHILYGENGIGAHFEIKKKE